MAQRQQFVDRLAGEWTASYQQWVDEFESRYKVSMEDRLEHLDKHPDGSPDVVPDAKAQVKPGTEEVLVEESEEEEEDEEDEDEEDDDDGLSWHPALPLGPGWLYTDASDAEPVQSRRSRPMRSCRRRQVKQEPKSKSTSSFVSTSPQDR